MESEAHASLTESEAQGQLLKRKSPSGCELGVPFANPFRMDLRGSIFI